MNRMDSPGIIRRTRETREFVKGMDHQSVMSATVNISEQPKFQRENDDTGSGAGYI